MKGEAPKILGLGKALESVKERQLWSSLAGSWQRMRLFDFFSESLDMAATAKPQSAYGKVFAAMKTTFDKLKEQSAQGAQDVPASPNPYIARLKSIKAHFYEEKKDGKPTGVKIPGAVLQFNILVGEYTGETAPMFPKVPVGDEEALLRFMRDLRRLGADIDNIDLEQPGALEAEYNRLSKVNPAVKIMRKAADNGGIFTNIVASLTEEQVEQLGGTAGAAGEVVEPVVEPVVDTAVEVAVEEPVVAVSVKKPAVPAKPVAAAAKPVAQAVTTARPAKPTAPVAAAVEEPGVEIEIGGDAEEPQVIEEPQPIEEVTEVPTIEIGSRVQFKIGTKLTFALVKTQDDSKGAWIVREEGTSRNLLVKYDYPSLALAE